MNNSHQIHTITDCDSNLSSNCIDIPQMIWDSCSFNEKYSNEKYQIKKELIKEAKDMPTQEKLDALDKNYERRNWEKQQNIFSSIALKVCFCIVQSVFKDKSIK